MLRAWTSNTHARTQEVLEGTRSSSCCLRGDATRYRRQPRRRQAGVASRALEQKKTGGQPPRFAAKHDVTVAAAWSPPWTRCGKVPAGPLTATATPSGC